MALLWPGRTFVVVLTCIAIPILVANAVVVVIAVGMPDAVVSVIWHWTLAAAHAPLVALHSRVVVACTMEGGGRWTGDRRVRIPTIAILPKMSRLTLTLQILPHLRIFHTHITVQVRWPNTLLTFGCTAP
jgi:hypothetical protein